MPDRRAPRARAIWHMPDFPARGHNPSREFLCQNQAAGYRPKKAVVVSCSRNSASGRCRACATDRPWGAPLRPVCCGASEQADARIKPSRQSIPRRAQRAPGHFGLLLPATYRSLGAIVGAGARCQPPRLVGTDDVHPATCGSRFLHLRLHAASGACGAPPRAPVGGEVVVPRAARVLVSGPRRSAGRDQWAHGCWALYFAGGGFVGHGGVLGCVRGIRVWHVSGGML
jgi:hypothetical protein